MALATRLEFTEDLTFQTREGEAFIEVDGNTIELMDADLDEIQEFIDIARENIYKYEGDGVDYREFATGGYAYSPPQMTLGAEFLIPAPTVSKYRFQYDGRDCE